MKLNINQRLQELPPQVKNGAKLLALVLLACASWFLFLYGAFFMLPLTLAFIVSQILEPLVKLLMKKFRLSRGISAIMAGLTSLIILGLLGFVIIANAVGQTANLIENLPAIFSEAMQIIGGIFSELETRINLIDPSVVSSLNSLMSSVTSMAFSGAKTLAVNVLGYVVLLPRGILFVVIFAVGTIIMMRERDDISAFFKKQLPMKWIEKFIDMRGDLILAMIGYIKAQVMIMIIVFVEMFIGFSVMGLRYSLIFALVVSIFDALPVFGAGLFMIPGVLISLLTGNYLLALGFLCIYVLTIIIRQSLEPKFVSNQIGIHPLITICAMYAGVKIAGIMGLILAAISMLVLKNFLLAILNGRTVKEYLAGAPVGSGAACHFE